MKISSHSEFLVERKNLRKKQARLGAQASMVYSQKDSAALPFLKGGALQKPLAAAAKRRRGRPRIEGKLREPNGRISRSSNPPALQALKARARHMGLSLDQAKDPRAASYAGRLSILGREDGLSGDQYDAAQQFLQLRNDYKKALLSPDAYYEATGIHLNADNMGEYEAWVGRVKKRYAGALKAIQEAQMDNGRENLYAALQYVVIDDQDLPYLLGAVRLVLNALCRHFKRAAAAGSGRKTSWIERYGISLAGMGIFPEAAQ